MVIRYSRCTVIIDNNLNTHAQQRSYEYGKSSWNSGGNYCM